MPSFDFDAPLWRWQARATDVWTFVSLPEALSDELLEIGEPYARGFGSLRVEVTVGATVWRTSVFPDHGRRAYVLPVKRAVREAEGLVLGASAHVRLRLVDLDEGTVHRGSAGRTLGSAAPRGRGQPAQNGGSSGSSVPRTASVPSCSVRPCSPGVTR